MKSRKVISEKSFFNEIHYQVNGKKYFGLTVQNISGGYEITSPIGKICLGKKDLIFVSNNSQIVNVFEGIFDYVSFNILTKNQPVRLSDSIILNSISLIHKAEPILKNYQEINLYLDNDSGGQEATEKLMEKHPKAVNKSTLFKGFKDVNEFLISTK